MWQTLILQESSYLVVQVVEKHELWAQDTWSYWGLVRVRTASFPANSAEIVAVALKSNTVLYLDFEWNVASSMVWTLEQRFALLLLGREIGTRW